MEIPVSSLIAGPCREVTDTIRQLAHEVHNAVNQRYDRSLPYGFHLDMVADAMMRHADEVLASPDDFVPLYFGTYFHDSIEDARLTYRDLLAIARRFLDEPRAVMATEISYALTNEKGRTRAERANDRYYEGIRATPYAPMVKLADRIANMTYSARHDGSANSYMRSTYASEFLHFLASISPAEGVTDRRLFLPEGMVEEARNLIS